MTERHLKPLPFMQTGSGAHALVFIHGLFDDGGFWRRTIEALETRQLALVTLDLPGMGKAADHPGPFSLERLAQAVTSVGRGSIQQFSGTAARSMRHDLHDTGCAQNHF